MSRLDLNGQYGNPKIFQWLKARDQKSIAVFLIEIIFHQLTENIPQSYFTTERNIRMQHFAKAKTNIMLNQATLKLSLEL